MKGGDGMLTILREFWQEESGVAVVEVILILVVLLALVFIFKNQLMQLVNSIFGSITSKSSSIYSD